VLPEPRWYVSGRPAWNWQDILRWAEETGRISGQVEKLTAQLKRLKRLSAEVDPNSVIVDQEDA
jgi:hypothetical protein